ncbi:LANO_0H05160g1_1 [Lachancea nothofagi CBS 11611]|uniref:LANO_0H05160g1_1 n=1 Tax=Lachancea nothofagi CBS 11611 TaxID=1266666 RepID=A0A1G4KL87_9SACH|nr:LANO_0H05160g1_1 [Lachancea nothofagi CBS 11611]
MAVWEHLAVSKSHVAYACVGVFSAIFSLASLFAKEKLYIGESTVAVIFGLIVGPHCLNWFNPLTWGNSDSITLEITRVVLCLQIFAVAVELPKKYMLKHWASVAMLLLPVMTAGWLVVALFVWIVVPNLNFPEALLISSCVTATDPILAQSVVSGKFAQRVPGHLRNLLSAESGCNDGMAFPFIYLSLNLLFYPGNGREIVKDWFCVTILYECVFGCILGAVIGYTGRRAIKFAEERKLIDRESFLAFYVCLAFICAGFGSILGADDLLVSFAAGTAFAWDGWFSNKTKESEISTIIDLLLNLAYFVYFGAIIPWQQFNDAELGLNAWRLIILGIVVITLRRIPAVLAFKTMIPDIKSWREAIFVGHFGPIGVGAIFAAIMARSELESHATGEETPLKQLPEKGTKYWKLIAIIWPITCFFIIVSIIVHGSSVAVITLGRHLNTITLTKSFTTHTTNGKGSSWMQRLPALDKSGRSFSLQRIDTKADPDTLARQDTVETSGVPAKPAGGMKRKRRNLKKRLKRDLFKSRATSSGGASESPDSADHERIQREREAQAAAFALSSQLRPHESDAYDETNIDEEDDADATLDSIDVMSPAEASDAINRLDAISGHCTDPEAEHLDDDLNKTQHSQSQSQFSEDQVALPGATTTSSSNFDEEKFEKESQAGSVDSYSKDLEKLKREMEQKVEEEEGTVAYAEGNRIIVENSQGEIIDQAELNRGPRDEEEGSGHKLSRSSSRGGSKMSALKRVITPPPLRRQTLIDEQANKRYFAYRIDGQLIIENDDGDVLRRYKINPHETIGSQTSGKQKGPGMVAKALSAVGLSKSTSASSSHPGKDQLPDPAAKIRGRRLTPVPTTGALAEAPTDENEFNSNEYEDDEEYDSDGVPDSEGDDYEDGSEAAIGSDAESSGSEEFSDEEPETAIERSRRLTALGHVAAPRRDDDEEESIDAAAIAPVRERDASSNKVKSALGRTFRKQ